MSNKSDIRPGNPCLFMIFVVCNFSLFLSSLGLLICSIYLIAKLKDGNLVDLCFLGCSLVLLCMTIIAFKARRSVHLLGLYLFILLIIFSVLMICSLVLTFNSTMVSTWAKQLYAEAVAAGDKNIGSLDEYVTQFELHIKEVSYAFLIFSAVVGLTMATGWCYRNSTLTKTW